MSIHVTDELPRLLTGEATREAVLAAAAHLRGCVDCQQELVSAVVAHASLLSAHRFAPEVAIGRNRDSFDESGDDRADTIAPRAESPTPGLPDLSAVFAQVREEAAAESSETPARTVRRRNRYLVAAAAAVIIGGGTAAAVLATSSDHSTSARTVQLSAFGRGTTTATAKLSGNQMRIDASSLPMLRGKGYEVWLTNQQRTAMQPIGWIGRDGTASIQVPLDLMQKYTDIEVSVQDTGASSYDYSNVSVLRGDYA